MCNLQPAEDSLCPASCGPTLLRILSSLKSAEDGRFWWSAAMRTQQRLRSAHWLVQNDFWTLNLFCKHGMLPWKPVLWCPCQREDTDPPMVAFLLCHLPIRIVQWTVAQRNPVERSLHRGLRKLGSGMALPFISCVAVRMSCPVLGLSSIYNMTVRQDALRGPCPIKMSQETVSTSWIQVLVGGRSPRKPQIILQVKVPQ